MINFTASHILRKSTLTGISFPYKTFHHQPSSYFNLKVQIDYEVK